MGIIKCENVCKSFGEKIALDNVNLDIPEGKIFGLLGTIPFPPANRIFAGGKGIVPQDEGR